MVLQWCWYYAGGLDEEVRHLLLDRFDVGASGRHFVSCDGAIAQAVGVLEPSEHAVGAHGAGPSTESTVLSTLAIRSKTTPLEVAEDLARRLGDPVDRRCGIVPAVHVVRPVAIATRSVASARYHSRVGL